MRRINGLLVAGIAMLSLAQAWAQQDDGVPKVTDPSIPLSYVGNDGSIAIGINSEGESEGKLTGIFARNDERAFIEQLWWDRSGAGGIQSDYNWLWGMTALEAREQPDRATVARLSFAVDQNGEHDRKATLGFGIERRAFSIEGYVARGISGARNDGIGLQSEAQSIAGSDELGTYTQVETTTVETVFASKPFDSEIGLQVSHFFEPLSMRVHAGASFQNGDGARSNTVSVGADAPLGKSGWGIAGLAEHVNSSGGIDSNDDDRFSLFLRYEFGRHGSFVPTSQLDGPAWIARSLGRESTAHPRTVETYRVRRSQTTSISRSPKEYTNLFPVARDDTATVSSGASVSIDVLANDNDPEGGTLSLLSAGAPTHGSAVIAGSQIIYTPASGFAGTDSFRYSVSDGQGGTGSALVTVTVLGAQANNPPIIRDDSASVMFGQSVAINVLANDSDPDGDALSVVEVGTPSRGSVSLSGNGVTYTPAPGFSGQDSFTYTASDGRGGQGSATVRITVAMQPNRDPVANNDTATTTGAPVIVNVLANDSDPDGDPLRISSVSTPANGTVVISGNAVRYTPTSGFAGTDRFTYTISDGRGGSATARVTITVTPPVNQPPVAVADTYTMPATASTLVLPVLLNDSDPDGDALTITSVTQPPVSGGTVSITDSGQTLTYVRQTTLPVTFTYTINDGQGHTATAQVTINPAPLPNQAPVAVNDTVFLIDGLVFSVLTNDSDPDGDPLTIIAVTQPLDTSGAPDGSVAITGSGQTVTFTAIGTVNIPATFSYTISDGQGGTDTAVVTILASP